MTKILIALAALLLEEEKTSEDYDQETQKRFC